MAEPKISPQIDLIAFSKNVRKFWPKILFGTILGGSIAVATILNQEKNYTSTFKWSFHPNYSVPVADTAAFERFFEQEVKMLISEYLMKYSVNPEKTSGVSFSSGVGFKVDASNPHSKSEVSFSYNGPYIFNEPDLYGLVKEVERAVSSKLLQNPRKEGDYVETRVHANIELYSYLKRFHRTTGIRKAFDKWLLEIGITKNPQNLENVDLMVAGVVAVIEGRLSKENLVDLQRDFDEIKKKYVEMNDNYRSTIYPFKVAGYDIVSLNRLDPQKFGKVRIFSIFSLMGAFSFLIVSLLLERMKSYDGEVMGKSNIVASK